jgi:hypothetical protein
MSQWTGYAPLGGAPPTCGFCGALGGPDGVLVTVGMHGGAICEECTVRLAEIMTRRRANAPQRRPEPPPIDPRDSGPPITVSLGQRPVGDLGHPRVDARLVLAIALRDQRVAAWLRERGIDEAAIRAEFGELDLGFDPTWP